MYDSYPKDFKGFSPKDERRRKQIVSSIKSGNTNPSALDEHDRAVVIKAHEEYEQMTKKNK